MCVCVSPGGYFLECVVDAGCPGDNFGGNVGVLEHLEV